MLKIVAIVSLALFIVAYLALCAYGIAKTGSTAGLADIGNAAVLSASLGVVALLAKR